MAGWFDSPSLFSGQAWSAWKQHLDKLNGLLVHNQSDDRYAWSTPGSFGSFSFADKPSSQENSQTGTANDSQNRDGKLPEKESCSDSQNRNLSTILLNVEDSAIYGRYQCGDDSYFVVCDLCGEILRPHSLKHHINNGHKNSTPVSESCSLSKPNSSDISVTNVKQEAKLDSVNTEPTFQNGDMESEMERVLRLILREPYSTSAVQNGDDQLKEHNEKGEMLLPGRCSRTFIAINRQQIFPSSEGVGYWHTIDKPPQPLSNTITSSEFIVKSETLMPSHRFDFFRSAMSHLVANLDVDRKSDLMVKEENPTGVNAPAAIVYECVQRLLLTIAPFKRAALMEKFSPQFVAGYNRKLILLQQLSSRDRYILSRICDMSQRKTASTNINGTEINVHSQENMDSNYEQPKANGKAYRKRKVQGGSSNGLIDSLPLDLYDCVNESSKPANELKKSCFVAPLPVKSPAPRPNILSRTSSGKSAAKSLAILPKNGSTKYLPNTDNSSKQPSLVIMAPGSMQTKQGRLSSPPDNRKAEHLAPSPSGRKILPSPNPASPQLIHFAKGNGSSNTTTAFIAIANGVTSTVPINGTTVGVVDQHIPQLAMVTIPVSSAAFVQQLQIQQTSSQPQAAVNSTGNGSTQAKLLPRKPVNR